MFHLVAHSSAEKSLKMLIIVIGEILKPRMYALAFGFLNLLHATDSRNLSLRPSLYDASGIPDVPRYNLSVRFMYQVFGYIIESYDWLK